MLYSMPSLLLIGGKSLVSCLWFCSRYWNRERKEAVVENIMYAPSAEKNNFREASDRVLK